MAFCRYSVLFLVRNFLSVLVRGGNESHSNRTPDLRILDDLHSPRRFYQALQTLGEPLPASLHHKLAPLGGPAFFLGVKGFPLLAEELAAWLLQLGKFWFCWLCWPFWKDCLPSWLTGGPNLWCTNSLGLPKDTSHLISCRLEATDTAETTSFLDALARILTCSCMILVIFSSGMCSSSDTTKESDGAIDCCLSHQFFCLRRNGILGCLLSGSCGRSLGWWRG